MTIMNKTTTRKIAVAFFALFITNQVQAYGHTYGGSQKVDRYYAINDDFIYLRMDDDHIDPANCGAAANSYYVMLRADVPAFDEYRKVILTAKAAGLNLVMFIRNEPGNCQGTSPKVSRMILE